MPRGCSAAPWRIERRSVRASSYSSRAAGLSRIAGNLPFRSHAWKKNCQSMNGTSSASGGSTSRLPSNGGAGSAIGETSARFARAASSGSSGLCGFFTVLNAEPLLQLAVLDVEGRAALRVDQRGDDVDDTTRIEHVHGLVRVLGRNLHRRMLA